MEYHRLSSISQNPTSDLTMVKLHVKNIIYDIKYQYMCIDVK